MTTRISVDVDLTIIDENQALLPGVVEGLRALKGKGCALTLWSYGGKAYARLIAKMHKLEDFFDEYATKPDLVIDDDFEALSHLPTIDARVAKDWSQISERAINLANDLDDRSGLQDVPAWIRRLSHDRFDVGVQSAIAIWCHREAYFRWPRFRRNISSNWVRHPAARQKECFVYPQELEDEIRRAGLRVDRRSNGPAIISFLLSGGERPKRPYPSRWGWAIHHIYDGRNPRTWRKPVPRAEDEPALFTDSGGLVAGHPVAYYIATREPLLAWLLRWEAFRRFNFDPMGVFGDAK